MILQLPQREVTLPARGSVMGILNINDDSFSGDGRVDFDWALRRASELCKQGADFIDIGAESARTNRAAISEDEEIRRFRGFIGHWPEVLSASNARDADQIWPPVLSINTWRPGVASAILQSGGELLNDMGGLPDDTNARLCAASNAALLIMHTVGQPKVNHSHVRWDNIMGALTSFFSDKVALARSTGLTSQQLILDPGLGFAKTPRDDLQILRRLTDLEAFDLPLLLPLGRKGFIGEVLALPEPSERDAGTLATMVATRPTAKHIHRVHEVSGAFEILKSLHELKTFF